MYMCVFVLCTSTLYYLFLLVRSQNPNLSVSLTNNVHVCKILCCHTNGVYFGIFIYRVGQSILSVFWIFVIILDVFFFPLLPQHTGEKCTVLTPLTHWIEGRLTIRRLQVWVLAGVAKEVSSAVRFLCWLLCQHQFHPHVTTVAHEKSQSFCQKCRWQVNAKHTCILHMWLCMK